jgi:hypothetical protein
MTPPPHIKCLFSVFKIVVASIYKIYIYIYIYIFQNINLYYESNNQIIMNTVGHRYIGLFLDPFTMKQIKEKNVNYCITSLHGLFIIKENMVGEVG